MKKTQNKIWQMLSRVNNAMWKGLGNWGKGWS